MGYDPNRHHRRSIRLRGYDYRQAGCYFVTIVAQGRELLFGQIVGGAFAPSAPGLEVLAAWDSLEKRFPTVRGDTFVLMPNHAHFVVTIGGDRDRGAETAPLRDAGLPTLGQIVAFLKYESTRWINAKAEVPGARVWQRNYYEHIVRDEAELKRIREYTAANPMNWSDDPENPADVTREV